MPRPGIEPTSVELHRTFWRTLYRLSYTASAYNKMVIEGHFLKNRTPTPGFEPVTFLFMSSCLALRELHFSNQSISPNLFMMHKTRELKENQTYDVIKASFLWFPFRRQTGNSNLCDSIKNALIRWGMKTMTGKLIDKPTYRFFKL